MTEPVQKYLRIVSPFSRKRLNDRARNGDSSRAKMIPASAPKILVPFEKWSILNRLADVTSCIECRNAEGIGNMGYRNVTISKRDKHKEYARYATYCLEMTAMAKDQDARTILREMAAEWLTLADGVLHSSRRQQTQMR